MSVEKTGPVVRASKGKNMTSLDTKLTAKNLKAILWDTLQKLKNKKIKAADADAIAIQSREIVRVVKSQMAIAGQSARPLTAELLDYAEG